MREKLNEKEIVRLVEEVSKLDEERRKSLDKGQVAEILRDLNLSDDLLDEAMVRLDQSKATAKRNRSMIGAVAAFVVAAGLCVAVMAGMNTNHVNQLSHISGSQTRMTTQANSSVEVSAVEPGTGTVVAHVTLQGVPLGLQVPMHARWIQPDGTVYHENSWQTKPATSSIWDTRAKCDITSGAPKGNWTVKFLVGDREVGSKAFVVN